MSILAHGYGIIELFFMFFIILFSHPITIFVFCIGIFILVIQIASKKIDANEAKNSSQLDKDRKE